MSLDDDVDADVPPAEDLQSLRYTHYGEDYAARLKVINSRAHKYPPHYRKIDWDKTDQWRIEGIEELPHPPAGQQYIYDYKTHQVMLVSCDDASYKHTRRRVTGKIDLKQGVKGRIELHLAEKQARARAEIKHILAATRVEVAARKRLAEAAARAAKK